MKSDLDCLLCLMRQALNTVRLATSDRELQRKVINLTAEWIKKADLSRSPADISTRVYRIVSEVTGVKDPYSKIKEKTNREALKMALKLRSFIDRSSDPLKSAIHLAVAGNIIDVGIGHEFDISKDIIKILNTTFAIDDTESFRKELKSATKLLYLGDNSGEIVFDKILIEEIIKRDVEVIFTVKSGPVINDATFQDALFTKISDIACVIETGSDDIGINFEKAGDEFLRHYSEADIILSKGHGNFESCNERRENFYFLLKAKCRVVAKELRVEKDDIVFKHQFLERSIT